MLTPEQEQKIYQTIVNQTPVDVGFPIEMNWTSPIIRKWIAQNSMSFIRIVAHGTYSTAFI